MTRYASACAIALVLTAGAGVSAQQPGDQWTRVVPGSKAPHSRPVLRVPQGSITFGEAQDGQPLVPQAHQPIPPVFGSRPQVVPIPESQSAPEGTAIDCAMVVAAKPETGKLAMKVITPNPRTTQHLKVVTPPSCKGR